MMATVEKANAQTLQVCRSCELHQQAYSMTSFQMLPPVSQTLFQQPFTSPFVQQWLQIVNTGMLLVTFE